MLYLVFNEGYGGNVDLAAEAIRLTRQLVALTDEPEVAGLLALMLLHHARRASRTGPEGRLVPLGEQDRSRWDTGLINEGYGGNVDLAAEAIRLTRQLVALCDEPEVAGLLALMLLHHARRASRTGPGGRLVPLAEQDRSRWDTGLISEGMTILQAALARDRLGEYQAQAAIAALHADAGSTSETDWVQIVEWYDELLLLTDSPVVRLNRAVAVGEADGPRAGLAALADLPADLPRYAAVTAYLHERAGDLEHAAELYAEASRAATSVPERDHLTREAARVRQLLRR